MPIRENHYEPIIKQTIESYFSRPFIKLSESSVPGSVPDLKTNDGLEPVIYFENKELESSAFIKLENDIHTSKPYESSILSKTWDISFTNRSLAMRIGSIPNSRSGPISPEMKAHFDKEPGITILTDQEVNDNEREKQIQTMRLSRDEELIDRYPKLNNLPSDIEPDLKILENHGCSRLYENLSNLPKEAQEAAWRVKQRCKTDMISSGPGSMPTIRFSPNWGGSSGVNPNNIAHRIQLYLETDRSDKLKKSLRPISDGKRHAAIVCYEDYEADTIARSHGNCPDYPLELGQEIDALWYFYNPGASNAFVWKHENSTWSKV